MLLPNFSRSLCKFSVNFYGETIYMLYSSINLNVYVHIIRYIFNKIVNLTKILFKSNLYNSIIQVGIFDSEILYKLQLVQPILYELQLVQTACTSCNLYKISTCT